MTRHYSSDCFAASSSTQTDDFGRQAKPDSVNLDAFVSDIYLPHVKLRTGNGCRETERRVP